MNNKKVPKLLGLLNTQLEFKKQVEGGVYNEKVKNLNSTVSV